MMLMWSLIMKSEQEINRLIYELGIGLPEQRMNLLTGEFLMMARLAKIRLLRWVLSGPPNNPMN
jgi:hypothetical protein